MAITTNFIAASTSAPVTVVCKSGTSYQKNANGMILSVAAEDINDVEQAGYIQADQDSARDNLAGTTAPTTGDDSADGYGIGSRWIDTTNGKFYICQDATAGSAVWLEADLLSKDQTMTGTKTFTNSKLKLLGSSTGATTFTSANAGATNYTITVPAANDTLTAIAATQTLTNKTLTAPVVNDAVLGGTIKKCTTEFVAVTGTTGETLTTVVGLAQTVVAGTYKFKIHLSTAATSNSGLKVGFKLTDAVLTSIESVARAFTASGVVVQHSTTATDEAALLGSTTAIINAVLEGTVVVGTGGTMQLEAAQNAAHADETKVLVGSYMEFNRIA